MKNLISLIILLFLFSCKPSIEKITQIISSDSLPIESGEDIEVLYSEYGKIVLKLNASHYDRYGGEKPFIEFPKGLKIQFYDSLMNIASELKCNYAVKKEKEKITEGKYDVVLINAKGERLNTEHLIWDETRDSIYTDAFVKITTPDEIIIGEGLEATADFSKYRIKKIQGTINVKEEE